MHQLIRSLTTGELFKQQLPVFLIAFGIEEFFYKFGSFALECFAFLLTWYVLDALAYALFRRQASSPSG
jgi:hypothetical protein